MILFDIKIVSKGFRESRQTNELVSLGKDLFINDRVLVAFFFFLR